MKKKLSFVKILKTLSKVIFIIISMFFFTAQTFACTPYKIPVTNYGNVVEINPGVQVGQVMGWILGVNARTDASSADCNKYIPWGNGSSNSTWLFSGIGVVNNNIYQTSIPGVGYRISWHDDQGLWNAGVLPDSRVAGTLNPVFYGGSFTILFIKTGPINNSGGLWGAGQSLAQVNINGYPWLEFYLGSGGVTIKETKPTCTVTQSVIPVILPDISQSKLNSAGVTAGDTQFTLPLNCTAATALSLSFSGDIVDSSKAVFKNTNSSTAASVGVQILKDGAPVPVTAGSYVSLGSVSGSVNVPFTARYYALNSGGSLGDVSTVAYASIFYN